MFPTRLLIFCFGMALPCPHLLGQSTASITCPKSISMDCRDFTPYLLAYGNAAITLPSGCADSSQAYNGTIGLSHVVDYAAFDTVCHRGTLARIFTAHDCKGGTSSCSQTIALGYVERYFVRFPDDHIITAQHNTFVPDSPRFLEKGCEKLEASFSDDTIRTNPKICFQIHRKWRIVNRCTYKPDCALIVVPNPQPNPDAQHPDNWPGPVVSDRCNIPNDPWRATLSKIGPQDLSPFQFCNLWAKKDSCVGTTSHFNGYEYTQILTFIDAKGGGDCEKPVIICRDLNIALGGFGTTPIWASDPLVMATDNETSPNDLALAISTGIPVPTTFPTDPLTRLPINRVEFNCGTLGPQPTQIWARDKAGNVASCPLIVDVFHARNCGLTILRGFIHTVNNVGIVDASIHLRNGIYVPLPFPLSNNKSDERGYYEVWDAQSTTPSPLDMALCPRRTDNPLNGVTTLDLALISRHILGSNTLDTPYKLLAADVNNSGSITTFDVVTLRKLILGIFDSLPDMPSWRFVREVHQFSDPSNPFRDSLPSCVSVEQLLRGPGNGNFIGIKIGDVNNTAIPNLITTTVDDRTQWPEAPLAVRDRSFLPGDVLEVDFTSNNLLSGQQFTLEHLGLQLLGIFPKSDHLGTDNFGQFPSRQTLTCSWNSDQGQQPHFALRFRALEAGTLAQSLRLSDAITPAEAYAPTPNTAQPVLMKPVLHFAPSNPVDAVQLSQNQPNPFRSATNIPFYLPQAGTATLRVFDAPGKLLHEQNGYFDKGWHQWTVSQQALGAQTGLLTYTLETNSTTLSKAMLLNK